MRKILVWIVLAVIITPTLFAGCEQEQQQTRPQPAPTPVDQRQAEIDAAVDRGLDWLIAKQGMDGLWHHEEYHAMPISCIAGLALLHRVNYGENTQRYRDAVYNLTGTIVGYANKRTGQLYKTLPPTQNEEDKKKECQEKIKKLDEQIQRLLKEKGEGKERDERILKLLKEKEKEEKEKEEENNRHPYYYSDFGYDHAFALLFLTQVYQSKIFSDAEHKILRRIIVQAISFAERHQDRSGCWYQNYNNGHNTFSTTMHIYALIAAKEAGFRINKITLHKARQFTAKYLARGISAQGISQVTAHIIGGWLENDDLHKSVQSVINISRKPQYFTSYYLNSYCFFTSTVCYYLGGEYWHDYYKILSTWYLDKQEPSGAWPEVQAGHARRFNKKYTTVVACLILQMPKRALPMYKNIDSALVRGKLGLEE